MGFRGGGALGGFGICGVEVVGSRFGEVQEALGI